MFSPIRTKDTERITGTNSTCIGVSKRTRDIEGRGEGCKGRGISKKAQRLGAVVIDHSYETAINTADPDCSRPKRLKGLTSPPPTLPSKPAFKKKILHPENPPTSNESGVAGALQDKQCGEQGTVEGCNPTEATGVNSEIGSTEIQHHRSGLCATNESLDHPNYPCDILLQSRGWRAVHGDDLDGRATKVVDSPIANTILASLPEQPRSQSRSAQNEEKEREITKIAGKRWVGGIEEYKVCWTPTWLPKNQLGGVQRLLQEFETKSPAQRGRKRGRSARINKRR
ncbi:MAG: hypothetical protein Q9217_004707 [Psora testacea]